MNKRIYLIILFLYSGLVAQVNTEKYRTAKDTLGFKFQSEINATIQKGNVEFQEVSIEALSQYNFNASSYLMIVSGDLGWEDGKRFSNSMLAHVRNIREVSAFLKLELFGQLDYDAEHLLLWRALAGAGTRILLFGQKDNQGWMGNSLFYEQEKYDLARSAKHARETNNIRFNTYLAINKKLKDFFTWHGVAYYQPKIDNWDDFKLIAETGLLVAFEENISLSIGFNYRYDSLPADGIKKNDYKTEMVLLISF